MNIAGKPTERDYERQFRPDLSPREMLEMGVFGGAYFDGVPEELPQAWFANARLSPDGRQRSELNYFGILASQDLKVWQDKGWIHPDDPKGWFQWYCRYHIGRRHPDDERQIKRWKAMTRHIKQVQNNCEPCDFTCRPRQRQALLHWAYDSRKI